jgi:hypothetical protein
MKFKKLVTHALLECFELDDNFARRVTELTAQQWVRKMGLVPAPREAKTFDEYLGHRCVDSSAVSEASVSISTDFNLIS